MKTVRMTDRWLKSISIDEGRVEYTDALTPNQVPVCWMRAAS